MKFQPIPEGSAVAARFYGATVYQIKGFVIEAGLPKLVRGVVQGETYTIATGATVNEASEALHGIRFAENEEDWRKDTRSAPPYLIVMVGPTSEHVSTGGHVREEGGGDITTMDAFPMVRSEISSCESRVLPPLITALTCAFNTGIGGRNVYLQKVDRVLFGRTASGATVQDLKFVFSANGFVAERIVPDDLEERLNCAAESAQSIDPKVAKFFELGAAETDEFKKFLYFFLALEVETHAVYGRSNRSAIFRDSIIGSRIVREPTIDMLFRHVDQLRGLLDRFVWCASFVWTNLDDADISAFRNLKRTRDEIAHGTISEPPAGWSGIAETLARKILAQGR